eukprot:656843-Rhodomonas_salina.1
MHPTLVAWNSLKAEAESSLSDAEGVEWSLRTRQPLVASALTSLVPERADVHELDSSQLLLHSSKESRATADRGSSLVPAQLPAGHRPPPAVPSHDQLSFDFQVGIEHLIATDTAGWTAHQRNGAVHLRDPAGS